MVVFFSFEKSKVFSNEVKIVIEKTLVAFDKAVKAGSKDEDIEKEMKKIHG